MWLLKFDAINHFECKPCLDSFVRDMLAYDEALEHISCCFSLFIFDFHGICLPLLCEITIYIERARLAKIDTIDSF